MEERTWNYQLSEEYFASVDDLTEWLFSESAPYDLDFVLVHSIDGVTWGRISDGELLTSHKFRADVSPPLHMQTLLELRLFNLERELYLWKGTQAGQWNVRKAEDQQFEVGYEAPDILMEHHILFGTLGINLGDNFTLLEDGSQGLRQIVPIDATKINERNTRPYMQVHHYLETDVETGRTNIVISRLASIEVFTYGY